MNPNHNPNLTQETPAPETPTGKPTYDAEVVITAEISTIQRDVELPNNFNIEEYKAATAEQCRLMLTAVSSELLKDPAIKVQVFLHEKSEKTPENV